MKKVFGMATIPQRSRTLKQVLSHVEPHVDYGYVVFNGYKEIPEFMKNIPKIKAILPEGDFHAAGKFWGMTLLKEDCFYYTCDDDIFYTDNYFNYMAEKAIEHNAVTVQHGRRFKKKPMRSSYKKGTTSQLCRFNKFRKFDVSVSFGGTGVMCINTKQFKIRNFVHFGEVFKTYYPTDVWIAIALKKAGVPIVSVKTDSKDGVLQKIEYEYCIADTLYRETEEEHSGILAKIKKEINKTFFGVE